MRTLALIPARYASSRFPGKPLVPLLGKPMVLWVADIAARALGRENVVVATEDSRIQKVVEEAGHAVVMTSEDALTGTDRLWEASRAIEADVYVNVQGDEPLLDPEDIRRVVASKLRHPAEVACGMCRLGDEEDPASIHIPKVVAAEDGRMIYMSRLAIPGTKQRERLPTYWKQVCIYAFTKGELERFGTHGRKSTVEAFEDIELLRFLDLGVPVRMVETSLGALAVDTPEDVTRVEAAMRRRSISP